MYQVAEATHKNLTGTVFGSYDTGMYSDSEELLELFTKDFPAYDVD